MQNGIFFINISIKCFAIFNTIYLILMISGSHSNFISALPKPNQDFLGPLLHDGKKLRGSRLPRLSKDIFLHQR
jgi:hypothetical protein